MTVDHIKQLLKKNGDTQGYLARHAEVSQQFINDCLNGKRSLPVAVARKFPAPYRSAALRCIAQKLIDAGRSILKEAKR